MHRSSLGFFISLHALLPLANSQNVVVDTQVVSSSDPEFGIDAVDGEALLFFVTTMYPPKRIHSPDCISTNVLDTSTIESYDRAIRAIIPLITQ